jgi:hypothetical protein
VSMDDGREPHKQHPQRPIAVLPKLRASTVGVSP